MSKILHQAPGATPLTADDMLGLRAKHIVTQGELNELESKNIIEGLTWLERRSKKFNILNDDVAREVHRRLFGKVWAWAGTFRVTEKNIGVPIWQISTEMRTCLGDAAFWRENATFNPLEAVARFHHRLVWIHPFPNGNGRWSRIMADAYLAGVDSGIFLDWSGDGSLQNESEHRKKYIAALGAADGHDFEPITAFVNGLAG